jgi:spore coat protein H
MRHGLVRLLASVLLFSTGPALGGASAQETENLFDDRSLQEIRLSINQRDLEELRERYQENVYFPVDLRWEGVNLQNVGVRSRGLSSRNATKPGLKLEFNHYVKGQRFLGLKSLVLDNLVTDPSLVRERLAMLFYQRLGQPAPRESFARVYINNVYRGVYAVVEAVDGDFLQRTGGDRGGYLFERHYVDAYRGDDLGDDPAAYRQVFEARTHERESDVILYSPIRDLFHQANQPVDAVWRESVERYLDLRQFVSYVAIEMFLSEPDGILGTAGMANFYLHRPGGSERHRLIPWDKDRTFADMRSSIFERAEQNILFTRAMAFDDLRRLYLDVLERCAQSATQDHWLEREIDRLAGSIEDAVREDEEKPYSNDEHDAAVAALRQFAASRAAFVLQDITRAREER